MKYILEAGDSDAFKPGQIVSPRELRELEVKFNIKLS